MTFGLESKTLWLQSDTALILLVGVCTQGATVKSLRVHHGRVVMVAPARTWTMVTTALVHQLTPVKTAASVTRVIRSRVTMADHVIMAPATVLSAFLVQRVMSSRVTGPSAG